MAFFGVTCLGDYQTLLKSQPELHSSAFCGISEEAFLCSFDKFVLSDSTRTITQARSIQAEGCHYILRESLLDILKDILGRRASKQEFDLFFTHFDFDSDCVMSREEFRRACSNLMQCISKDAEQREWYSFSQKHADWLRHKRLPYSPQETLTRDLTESQRVGYALTEVTSFQRASTCCKCAGKSFHGCDWLLLTTHILSYNITCAFHCPFIAWTRSASLEAVPVGFVVEAIARPFQQPGTHLEPASAASW